MSDATKQRTWRDLLLEDFKDTRNVPAKGDSEERMLARVDAWAACLDQLESQNQALQEELRKYRPGQGEGWPDDRHEFAGRLTTLREVAEALQEALQRALDRYDREDNGTLKVRDGLAWAMAQDLRDALSPTQETDPG